MRRATGIGGIFFKSRDPRALGAWYRDHLGIELTDWGGPAFAWASPDNPAGIGTTIWNPFQPDTDYFAPSDASFMVNFRVADLYSLLAALREEGCEVVDKTEESEIGNRGQE